MPVLAVLLLLVGSVLSLLLLAVVLVVATDQLRGTVDRLLAVRDRVQPALEALQTDVAQARAGLARIEQAKRRPGAAVSARTARGDVPSTDTAR